jgi:hypothetical protein
MKTLLIFAAVLVWPAAAALILALWHAFITSRRP